MNVSPLTAFALLALTACIDASQAPIAYDAVAVARGNGVAAAGAWSITLTRADVALGPFYFCAAASGSSTLCESSVAEVRGVTVVNALASTPQFLGRVHGFSGAIQSVSYDLGISWFDTQRAATPAPALPGGHSIQLEGVAKRGAVSVTFRADIDVVPQFQGQNAISTAPAKAAVQPANGRLAIVLEPAAWLKQVDFDAVALTGERDLVIAPGSSAHNAILVGLKNLSPITFAWSESQDPVATP